MAGSRQTTHFRSWLWLIAFIGVIVPRRLRADWRQEWEAELRHREVLLAEWDRLDWRKKFDLLRRSLGAFRDALLLQPRRLEDEMFQDLSFGARMLVKNPGFTLIAVVTLAVGIGANTAIFSVVNAALLRPLPFAEPDRLVFVGAVDAQGRAMAVSAADFNDFRRSQSFEQIAAHRGRGFTITGDGDPVVVSATTVSTNFLAALRVRAALGRTFLSEDTQAGAARVVVLSHHLWRRRFGASAGVIGQKLTSNGESYNIVGVLPPDFSLWGAEVWLPGFAEVETTNRADRSVGAIARLKPGVSIEQARAELETIARQLEQEHAQTNQGWGARVLPLREAWYGDDRKPLLALMGAATLVLLIACVNVTSLLLARAAARGREMAIRAALGGTRLRLVRQLLVESLLLAGLGALAGLLLANWSLNLLVTLIPSNMLEFGIPGGAEAIRIDTTALLFTMGTFLLMGLGFGLAPALRTSKTDLSLALKEGGRSATPAGSRLNLQQLLVVAEIAVALTLLIGAGLMVRSFARLEALDRGFNRDNVLNLSVGLPQSRYRDDAQRAEFFSRAIEGLQALPGVESVGASTLLSARGRAFTIQGRQEPTPGQEPRAIPRVISPGYFQTVGIPLRAGRHFTSQDTANAPGVCIVNQELARRFWPYEDPIGKQIRALGSPTSADPLTIVGVVGDVKEMLDPRAPLMLDPQPTLYRTYLQASSGPSGPVGMMTLSVRTKTDPLSMAAALRREIQALDKELPVTGVRTARQALAESMARPRFNTLLLGLFAGAALLLAAVGVYGVMAYAVSQRTQEIGIRVALGARRRDILKLALGQGLTLTVVGLGIGLAVAAALTRVIASQLYGVTATDPATFIVIPLLLTAVAFVASYIPTRRAMKVDPMVVLRRD
jgi:putative ABC transport system permease protein